MIPSSFTALTALHFVSAQPRCGSHLLLSAMIQMVYPLCASKCFYHILFYPELSEKLLAFSVKGWKSTEVLSFVFPSVTHRSSPGGSVASATQRGTTIIKGWQLKKEGRRGRGWWGSPFLPLFLWILFRTLNLSQSKEPSSLKSPPLVQSHVQTNRMQKSWIYGVQMLDRQSEGRAGRVWREAALILIVPVSEERSLSALFVFQEETSEHLWCSSKQHAGLELQRERKHVWVFPHIIMHRHKQ